MPIGVTPNGVALFWEFGHASNNGIQRIACKTWCGRRDLNPHGPFKPCGFSFQLRLSPLERYALGGLTPGVRSGLSLQPPPKHAELRCCGSSIYAFGAGVSLRAWLEIAI